MKQNNHLCTPWTPERCQLLRALVAEGLSYSAIARRMPFRTTRSAIAGKVNRLGWARKAAKKTAWLSLNAVRGAKIKKAALARKAVFVERLSADRAAAKTLPMLGPDLGAAAPGVCRYIASDPQISARICGRIAECGAWCADHRSLVYSRIRAPARHEAGT